MFVPEVGDQYDALPEVLSDDTAHMRLVNTGLLKS